jgi:hypothetical protein
MAQKDEHEQKNEREQEKHENGNKHEQEQHAKETIVTFNTFCHQF